MTKLLHLGEIVNVDCGAYRCRECAYLSGTPNNYGCGLFGDSPATYPGPFAKGDPQRSVACQMAEDALRVETAGIDDVGEIAALRAENATLRANVEWLRVAVESRPSISPELAARYLGNQMSITSYVRMTEMELQRKLREHARKVKL